MDGFGGPLVSRLEDVEVTETCEEESVAAAPEGSGNAGTVTVGAVPVALVTVALVPTANSCTDTPGIAIAWRDESPQPAIATAAISTGAIAVRTARPRDATHATVATRTTARPLPPRVHPVSDRYLTRCPTLRHAPRSWCGIAAAHTMSLA